MIIRNTFTLALLFSFLPFFSFSQKPVPALPVGHAGQITGLDFSPDGKFAVSCAEDGNVKLWELSSGRLLHTWYPSEGEIEFRPATSVAFSKDGEEILAGSFGNPLLIWDNFKSGEKNTREFIDPNSNSRNSVMDFGISKNGQEVISLTSDNKLTIWNIKSATSVRAFSTENEKMTSVCLTPDTKTAYTGTRKGKIIKWSTRSGEQLDNIDMHTRDVNSLSVSPNGKMVLSGSKDYTLKLWDISNKKILQSFNNAYSPGHSSAFSNDSKYFAFGNNDHSVIVWDIENGKAVDTLRKHSRSITEVRFSPDDKFLLSGSMDKSVILWTLETGEAVHELTGSSSIIKEIAFSPDKETALMVEEFENDIVLWDANTGAIKQLLTGHENSVSTAAFSPQGDFLLSGSDDKTLAKWDAKTGQRIASVSVSGIISQIAISPDEKTAMTTTDNDTKVSIWNLDLMKVVKTINDHSKKVTSLSFTSGGQLAMTGSNDGAVKMYTTRNWAPTKNILSQLKRLTPVAFAPNSKHFLSISCQHSTIELWDAEEKKIIKDYDLKYDSDNPTDKVYCGSPTKAVFSPDGSKFLLTSGNNILLWHIDKKAPIFLKGHQSLVKTVAFTPNGRTIVSGGYDGSLRFWDANDGNLVSTVSYINNEDWVAVTQSGLFDASPKAMDQMYFVQGVDIIELAQLKDRYHEPDLMPISLGKKNGVLRDVGSLSELALPPDITEATIADNKLDVTLNKRTGGIGRVNLFINGSIVEQDICGGKSSCPPIDLTKYQAHFFGKKEEKANNVVSVVAYNEEGWLKSEPYEIYPYRASARGEASTNNGPGLGLNITFSENINPSVHAIIIGISEYSGESIDLGFPAKDAQAMATAIENITKEYFEGRVNIHLLTTDATDQNLQPTKPKIRAAFETVQKSAKAEDVFMLFMAGHGKTYSNNAVSDFYYLTMSCGDMKLDAEDVRNEWCIATDTLTEWISHIPAKKRVVIFDACHSGKAAENLMSRDLTTSQKKEMERLKDRNGMFVLASSESSQRSWEDSKLQQGLLTYSLLHGLKTKDGIQPNGAVDVLQLFQFSRDYVPQMAKGIDQDQTPVLTIPSGDASSFSIGWVNDPAGIPLGTKNEFLSQSMFLDKSQMNDHLQLSNLLDEHFAEDPVEGKLGKMIFVNARQMHEAHAIRGLYEVKNGMINLDGRIFQKGKEITSFKVENIPVNNHRLLVKEIVRKVNEKL